jgi:hypothetical protein
MLVQKFHSYLRPKASTAEFKAFVAIVIDKLDPSGFHEKEEQ